MTAMAYQNVTDDPTTQPTFAAVATGDTIPYDPNGVLIVKNASAGAITVTITPPGTLHGQNMPAASMSVPAAVGGVSGVSIWKMTKDMAAAATGLITLTYSASVTISAAALRIPPL